MFKDKIKIYDTGRKIVPYPELIMLDMAEYRFDYITSEKDGINYAYYVKV
jgi:hypothetical protein